ncbi:MAG: hypothetical protein HC921_01610 [Synechococcaceae cyanobacterium SM2_3_1]|nr:hypothetical protein [Synechococcaceae cyanobacterium SM2_3_1]
MIYIDYSYRFQIPFPERAPELLSRPPQATVESRIMEQYVKSIDLRLGLLTHLRNEGKLTIEEVKEELQLLRHQGLQTLKDLGIIVAA